MIFCFVYSHKDFKSLIESVDTYNVSNVKTVM